MKIFVLAIALSAVTAVAEELKRVDVGPNAESVTKGFGGKYFVSLTGASLQAGDGDGSIVRIENDQAFPFAIGLSNPRGMVFLDALLIVVDDNQVWRIDAGGAKTLLANARSFPRPVASLGDVAVAGDGTSVLVSDTGGEGKAPGWVYQVALNGVVMDVIAGDERLGRPSSLDPMANGKIRVADSLGGTVFEWSQEGWLVLAKGHEGVQGIGHDRTGNLYISESGSGTVFRYIQGGGEPMKLVEGLSSAGDLLIDDEAGLLIVPDVKAGQLVFVPI